MFGSTSLDFCQIAAGRLDGLVQLPTSAWDYLGGYLIAKEAGATITNLSGDPPDFSNLDKQSFVVTSPELHQQALSLLGGQN